MHHYEFGSDLTRLYFYQQVLHHLLIVEKVWFKVLGVLSKEFYKFWGFCAARGGISGSFGLGTFFFWVLELRE
ncbi:hypothetical protein HanXRQr2_Chr17g0823731 [Helianthus annuus]|uniref:Uncharacterized protein n=1 Tax=Helianthus annuus TaxID=4232 RepID=A0A251UCC7_HELAN|nr:hypothetical protein HanXRQr2_Chr17g0823731 [Helianthus annuus]